MATEPTIIACCVSTLHRAAGLARTLASLARQQDRLPEGTKVIAVVVNNDPDDDRPREVVEAIRREHALEVTYATEPQRGVAHPRNRALALARLAAGPRGLIAFIDDDEEAQPGWLAALFDAHVRLGRCIVTGPVDPSFDEPPPDWIVEGGFFAPTRLPTGTPRPWAFTNNVMFAASLVGDEAPRFATGFLRAGEDRHFFERLRRAGTAIRWVDEARVVESIAPQRATEAWLVRRQRTVGRCVAPIERDLRGAAWSLAACSAKGIAWILIGSARRIAARTQADRVRALTQRAWGIGLLEGAWKPSTAGRPVDARD